VYVEDEVQREQATAAIARLNGTIDTGGRTRVVMLAGFGTS